MKIIEKIKNRIEFLENPDNRILDENDEEYRFRSRVDELRNFVLPLVKQLESDIEIKNNIIDKRDEEILNLMAQVNDEANEVGKLKLANKELSEENKKLKAEIKDWIYED